VNEETGERAHVLNRYSHIPVSQQRRIALPSGSQGPGNVAEALCKKRNGSQKHNQNNTTHHTTRRRHTHTHTHTHTLPRGGEGPGNVAEALCEHDEMVRCKKINRSHTHTHGENNTPDTHTHDQNNTPNPQTNTPHKHLTTLEGGATTVRATSMVRCE